MPQMVRLPGQTGLAPISEVSPLVRSAADNPLEPPHFALSPVQSGVAAGAVPEPDGEVVEAKHVVPMSLKMAIGVGGTAMAAQSAINGFYLQIFLLETACVPARTVGTLQLVQGLWDALNDPVVGHLSNKLLCGESCGRRRPWLFFASAPLGIFFCLLWQSLPPGTSETVKFYYYLLMYCGLSLAITMVEVQCGCASVEATQDYDERTVVTTYRLGLASVLALPMVIFHGMVVRSDDSLRDGYSKAGIIFGALLSLCPLVLALAAKPSNFVKHVEDPTAVKLPYWQGLLIVFQNKAFVCVMFMHMFGLLSIAMIQVNVFLWLKYVLKREDLGNAVIFCVQGIGLACFPLWSYIAKKVGKKRAFYMGATTIGVSLMIGLVLVPPLFETAEDKWYYSVLPTCIVVGFCLAVIYLIPSAMLPDVVEVDELQTGLRREGTFVSVFTVLLKLSYSGTIALSNYALDGAGYKPPVDANGVCGGDAVAAGTGGSFGGGDLSDSTQPEAVIVVLKVLVGVVPAIFCFAAVFCAFLFPISKESHQETVEKIKEKKTLSLIEADRIKEELRAVGIGRGIKMKSSPPRKGSGKVAVIQAGSAGAGSEPELRRRPVGGEAAGGPPVIADAPPPAAESPVPAASVKARRLEPMTRAGGGGLPVGAMPPVLGSPLAPLAIPLASPLASLSVAARPTP